MADIYQVNEIYRDRLRSREVKALTEMSRTYEVILEDNLKRLSNLQQLIDTATDEADLAALNGFMVDLQSLNVQMAQAVSTWSPTATEIAKQAQQGAIQLSIDIQEDLVRAVAGVPDSVSMVSLGYNRLPVEAIQNVVGFAGDGSALADLFDAIGPYARDHVVIGMASSDNPEAVAKRMAKTYKDLGISRAHTIARTEMIRANREAQRQSFAENFTIVKGWVRVSAGDQKVCVVCWGLQGQVQDLAQVVPSHPNCRCTVVPVTPSYAELAGLPEGAFDEPEPLPTRDESFMMLSESERRNVLGPSRYRLWETGTSLDSFGRVVQDPKWGPQAVVIPLKDL